MVATIKRVRPDLDVTPGFIDKMTRAFFNQAEEELEPSTDPEASTVDEAEAIASNLMDAWLREHPEYK